MKTSTKTIIAAMRILEVDIQTNDGVANAAIREAADRLAELEAQLAAQAGQEPVLFVSESCIEFLKTKRSFDMKLQISGHSYSFDADNIKLYVAQPAPANTLAIVPPEWVSEVYGEEVDDLSYGQGYRRGFNDCRAKVLEANPKAPVNPLAIVQAALEAAAAITEKFYACDDATDQSEVNHVLTSRAHLIRAIDPKTVIEGMSK